MCSSARQRLGNPDQGPARQVDASQAAARSLPRGAGHERFRVTACHPTPNALLVQALVAQLRVTLQGIADFDTAIAQRAQEHPDFALFEALPGAGAVFAPRLLAAFGEQRERYASAEELQKYAGIAPVTDRSGKKSWVHWRLQCPKFLRQTFVEWAAESTRHSFWAQVYYQQQRARGKAHQAAVRALAFKWIRILYRCWQDRTPYDESVYLQALNNRGASLLQNLVHEAVASS
jgi:transposase